MNSCPYKFIYIRRNKSQEVNFWTLVRHPDYLSIVFFVIDEYLLDLYKFYILQNAKFGYQE